MQRLYRIARLKEVFVLLPANMLV